MEKEIKIASRLYEIRETAMQFCGDKYKERIRIYKQLLSAMMTKHNISAPDALIKISEGETYKTSDAGKIMFIAACAEIMMEG